MANLLGAAGLVAADLARAAVDEAGGRNPSRSAALVTLAREPGTTATDLAEHVKLTQPAVSRLVDGLESDGLIERAPDRGRSVPLRLTAAGQATVRRLLDGRGAALEALVARLDGEERRDLERLLEKVLDGAFGRVRSAHVLCRLCDHHACVGGGATCPVSDARRAREEAREEQP